MICKSCNFENREGALFCAECGAPLASANNADKSDKEKTVLLDEVVTNSKESVDNNDESEANTTVLTSDMLKPAQAAAAPKGFTPGPASMKPMAPANGQPAPQAPKMAAPQGAPMNPQGAPMAPQGMAPANGQPAPQAPKMAAPQGAPMAPQGMAPANGQPAPQAPKMAAPQGAPMNPQGAPMAPQGMAPANGQPAPQAPAAPAKDNKKADKKADKKAAKAEKKEKKKGGNVAYIVISVILMLGMAGALVYGYIYHTDKMEAANTEIENLKASNSDAQATISQKNNELANLYASSTDAQATISSLETQLADAQANYEAEKAKAESYASYDELINFVDTCSADSNTDMLVSDTVVSTTAGSTVEIYVYFPSQEGKLNYVVSNVEVVDCTWGEEWVNGNVLPITIQAKSAGNVTIEITNDQNDIKETVFVKVK